MSEAKFTKGEWVAHITPVYLNHGYASVESGEERIHGEHMYNSTETEVTANAHLIAAAPEMYAMLEFITKSPMAAVAKAPKIKELLAKARGEK